MFIYRNFNEDVQSVFSEVIQKYSFREISFDFNSISLQNDVVELTFTVMEEDMGMSITTAEHTYGMKDIARITDPVFYNHWEQEATSATLQLYGDHYYKTWLQFLKILSDKYANDLYSGIPMSEEMITWQKSKDKKDELFNRAWNAMQQLSYDHPVCKKYIANDYSWINDMILILDKDK